VKKARDWPRAGRDYLIPQSGVGRGYFEGYEWIIGG